MRILAWNIQHGGGPARAPEIALALLETRADVVVLTEFRASRGGQIAGVLHDHGLCHSQQAEAPPGSNAVCICARWPLRRGADADAMADHPHLARRWLDVEAPDLGLRITGVHVPDANRSDARALARKSLYWQRLNASAAASWTRPRIILGDFNSGRPGLDHQGAPMTSAAQVGRLETLGYADAFRHLHALDREFTWRSPTGAGFRLDHAYVSEPLLPLVRRVRHLQEHRDSGLSDHASLLVELAISGAEAVANVARPA